MKQKIVGVIHELTMGGAERMMVNILNHFALDGKANIHLIIFKNIGVLKEQLAKNIEIHDLESSSVKMGIPKCLVEIYRIKPHILFSGIGHLNIALAPFIPLMRFFLRDTRWIARETNIVSLQNQESKYPKLFDFLYNRVYKNFDVIIAQSKDMKRDLESNYPKCSSKVTLINNPIDIKKVVKLSKESSDFLFSDEKINLITVGTLRYKKRHDLLLKSFALLPDKYRLIIVGSGAEESRLKRIVVALNLKERVVFAGHQSNPYPYIKHVDLFILTSEHEGFPNVLLEANALGLPIVSFSSPGGITEIIEEGINGFTVPYGKVEKLALKIEEAIDYGFNKEDIVDSVKRRFSEEIIFLHYENIFYNKRSSRGV